MRLADLGARVIKIERPGTGDIGRTLAFAGRVVDGDTVSFHAMNRNKESITADLKVPSDLDYVTELVARADVMIQNFRPGVMKKHRTGLRIGQGDQPLDRLCECDRLRVRLSVAGSSRPGSARAVDLRSPVAERIEGRRPDPRRSVDRRSSAQLPHRAGRDRALVRRFRTGEGGLVESSLLESMLDLQFELLSTN